jgi:hypothetical protein
MWLIHQFDSLLHLGDCKEYPTMAKAKNPRTNTPKNGAAVENQVVAATETQPQIKELKKPTPEVRKNVFPINLDEEIRRRAYELWEQRGHEPGHETEHWLLAETEILTRYSNPRQQSA